MRLLLLVLGAVLVGGCSDSGGTAKDLSALDKASVAFEGTPSRTAVQAAMDEAFSASRLAPSEDSYSRAGSVLVTQRQRFGASEMSVLACVPSHVNDPRIAGREGETFVKASALCALIVSGAYPSSP